MPPDTLVLRNADKRNLIHPLPGFPWKVLGQGNLCYLGHNAGSSTGQFHKGKTNEKCREGTAADSTPGSETSVCYLLRKEETMTTDI